MKKIFTITLIVLVFGCKGNAQKWNAAYHYKFCDTMWQYKNAYVLLYRDNGVFKKDTLYFNKMKKGLIIDYTGVMEIDGSKVLPKPSPLPDTTKPLKIKMQPRWRDDRILMPGDSGYVIIDDIDWPLYEQNDTTKVIMLVADTSSLNGFRSSRCFWMYGYRVRGEDILEEWGGYIYLDDRRLPIPKNIVVFLSKELK